MRKVCAEMVPKLLSDERKEGHKELCLNLLQCIENKPDLLNSIITCADLCRDFWIRETGTGHQVAQPHERYMMMMIITCDETWIFTYDPETKQQSMQWKSTSSPRPKKARMSRSRFKDLLIAFSEIQGILMAEWVPSGQTVNQQYYIEVLTKLLERVRRKRPEL